MTIKDCNDTKQGFPLSAHGGKQTGAVLIFSLIFMLMTAMIVGTLLTSSSTEIKMAINEQFRLEAGQKSESIIDVLFDEVDKSEEDGYLKDEGQRLCVLGDTNANCVCALNPDSTACIAGAKLPDLPAALIDLVPGETLDYYIEYQSGNVPAHTFMEASSGTFGLYEIHVEYDASELGQGKSKVVQGIVLSYGERPPGSPLPGEIDIYRDIGVEL